MISDLGITAINNCLIAAMFPYLIKILKNQKVVLCIILLSVVVLILYGFSRLLFFSFVLSYLLVNDYKINTRWVVLIGIIAFVFLYLRFESAFGRLLIYWIILSNVIEIPVFGYGFNSFKYVYCEWQSLFFKSNNSYGGLAIKVAEAPSFAFNEFFQVWIEFGGIALILMIFVLLFHLFVIKKNDTPIKIARLSNLIIFIFSFFSYPLHSIFVMLIFFGNFTYILSKMFSKVKYIFISGVAMFCFYVFFIFYNDFKGAQKWRELSSIPFSYAQEKDSLYRMAFPYLKNNQLFLNDYTQFLIQAEQLEAAQELIYKQKKYYNQYERLMLNGDIWFKRNSVDSAIIYYLKAHNFIPSKFLPVHLLTICYLNDNQISNAKKMSKLVKKMPIKVSSRKILYIKAYADSVLKF